MADKKLSDTTDQEMVLEYVEQLKQDNKRLKGELEAKRRPLFNFVLLTKLLRDIADHGATQTLFVISLIALGILAIYGLVSISGPTGEYYVVRAGNQTEIIGDVDCKCPEPERITKPCFKVNEEFMLGEDDPISDCYEDKDEAYKAATEFADEWEKLHARQENE
jgi:hypothetical protein